VVNKKTRNQIKMANRNGYPIEFISFLAKVSEDEVIEVLEKGLKEKYLTTEKMPKDYVPAQLRFNQKQGRFLPRGMMK
jgi:hypothetical protein